MPYDDEGWFMGPVIDDRRSQSRKKMFAVAVCQFRACLLHTLSCFARIVVSCVVVLRWTRSSAIALTMAAADGADSSATRLTRHPASGDGAAPPRNVAAGRHGWRGGKRHPALSGALFAVGCGTRSDQEEGARRIWHNTTCWTRRAANLRRRRQAMLRQVGKLTGHCGWGLMSLGGKMLHGSTNRGTIGAGSSPPARLFI